jgi:two-component system, OmpR family, response regulator
MFNPEQKDNSQTILVVDDDKEIRDLLSEYLTKYGYKVLLAKNGAEMERTFALKKNVNLVLLDLMLPDTDGFTLCKKICQISNIPIIILTAMDNETDRVLGLELGADDYQVKPFNPRELLARIKAVTRRTSERGLQKSLKDAGYKIYRFAGWKLDTAMRRIFLPDQTEVILTSGEYDLLLTFLESPQRVLNRDQLLESVSDRHFESFDRSIDVQVSRLRQKLGDDPKNPKIIKTIRNGGYMFAVPVKYE